MTANDLHIRFAAPALLRGVLAAALIVIGTSVSAQSIDVKDSWLKRNCLDKGSADHQLVGKEFEACLRKQIEALPALDKSKREFFGERYDPKRYVECRLHPQSRNDSACNVYILRRREWPEYWPMNAHRVRWPDVPQESVYRRGMESREYWQALCKKDAGEFIYRTVQGADGFLIVRPRGPETDIATQDRYVIEDGYGFQESQYIRRELRPGKGFFQRSSANYRYVEGGVPHASGLFRWVRHELSVEKLGVLLRSATGKWSEEDFTTVSDVAAPKSLYGISWRGIHRENDHKLGISGGELAIVDLATGNTLALRRGYALEGYAARGNESRVSWLGSWGCPVMARDSNSLRDFVNKVLVPAPIL